MPPLPPTPTLLDRIVSWVSPEAGVTRMAARMQHQRLTQFGYHAVNATHSRGGSGGMFNNASPNTPAMERDRVKLMWESRDQELNMPFTAGLLNRTAHFAFPRLRYQALTGDKKISDTYEQYIAEKMKRVDMGNRFSLHKLAELAYRSRWRDGDCGFVMSEDTGELKLEPFEADCIGNVQQAQSLDEREIGGMVLNEFGQITGVKLYSRTRNVQYKFVKEVPVSRFLHIMDPFRLSQVRGHSPLASIHADVRDLYEVFNYDMMGIKHAASFAGFFQVGNPNDANSAAAWSGKDEATGLNYMNAQGGRIVRLPEGTRYVPAPAVNRPSGEFMAFVQMKVRMIMNALDLPYSFGWDLAAFGGVTARLETRYADHRFDYDRQALETQLLNPWVQAMLMRGIQRKEIPAVKHWKRGKWNYGENISADILNDTNARAIAVAQGWMTSTDIIEKAGGDYEDTVRTNARQIKIKQRVCAEEDVPMELLDQSLANPTQQIAAMNERGNAEDPAQQQGPPPPAGLLASHDPKAGKLLLDVIKQFNQGLMSHGEAMGTLIQLFGLTPEDAAMVLPQQQPTAQPQPQPTPDDTGSEA